MAGKQPGGGPFRRGSKEPGGRGDERRVRRSADRQRDTDPPPSAEETMKAVEKRREEGEG